MTPRRRAPGGARLARPAERPSDATGVAGEQAAADLVRSLGWLVLDRNWRHGHLELDIVAEENDTVVFLEVKTRRSGGMQSPAEALTPSKRARLRRAAQAWICEHDAWDRAFRFDLACVTAGPDHFNTELMKDVIDYGEADPGHALGGGHASWQPW